MTKVKQSCSIFFGNRFFLDLELVRYHHVANAFIRCSF
ncbi:hypothetical protein P689_122175 [Candidatus Riesia pediculischaeffi PTSU]|uniref:Uncharacterized protein n=1 Tax=Candidatus Riesia pediculischaeffi PTSU TaxID=1401651 RepID=A0A0C1S9P8_9ENTR|nr:hypothetical protein P689_122175 [Candidatus Riesia pediculischaeffi PTSU]